MQTFSLVQQTDTPLFLSEPNRTQLRVLPVMNDSTNGTEPSWLEKLAAMVYASAAQALAGRVQILPAYHVLSPFGDPQFHAPSSPLLVTCWNGGEDASVLNALLHTLCGEDGMPRKVETLLRPEPAPAGVFSLSALGGWSGGTSNAGLIHLVHFCPGWDLHIRTYESLFFLSPDTQEVELRNNSDRSITLIRQLVQADGDNALATFELKLYCSYLARVLLGSISAILAYLCAHT